MYKIVIALILIISVGFAKKIDRSISHQTFETLTAVQKLLGEEKNSEALAKIRLLHSELKQARAKPYEFAFVARMEGYIHLSMDNYDKAIEQFEKALEGNLFAPKEHLQLLTNTASLYMAQNKFEKALTYFERYLKEAQSYDASTLVSIASCYNELGKKAEAIKYLKEGISLAKKPKLSWYEMLLGLYYSVDDYPNSIATQEKIIELFGVKKSYLLTLSSLYQYVDEKDKALATLESAYEMGYFEKEDDYTRLAYLWLENQTPEKSARMIQRAINDKRIEANKTTLQLLADSYNNARELDEALISYKQLANLTKDANIYAQIAQTYLELESYDNAIKYFTLALEGENLTNRGGAYLLRGITYFELEQKSKARDDFIQALKDEKSASNAKEWLKYTK
jgi:tetratricopeptide (TPR) repeat protein